MKSDLVDIEAILHHETEKAVLVSVSGEREKAVWIPLSLCEIERKGRALIVVTLPERLAIEKGLV